MLCPKELYPAFGIEKIEKELEEHNRRISEVNAKLGEAVMKMGDIAGKHEKEADWAVMGGIAHGIGGLGAGVSAAAQTQINNMEVRARNAQRDIEAANLYSLGAQFKDMPTPNAVVAEKSLKVCIENKTENLFRRLSLHCDLTLKSSTIISFYDSNPDKTDTWIDGYLIMEVYNKEGSIYAERIIPVPFWQGKRSASLHAVPLPTYTPPKSMWTGGPTPMSQKAERVEFRPLVLWEVAVTNAPNYYEARNLSDIPDSENKRNFIEEWNRVYSIYDARIQAKKKEANRQSIIYALAVGVTILFFIIFFIIMINH